MPAQKEEKSPILDSADSSTSSLVLVGCPPESYNALTALQQSETPPSSSSSSSSSSASSVSEYQTTFAAVPAAPPAPPAPPAAPAAPAARQDDDDDEEDGDEDDAAAPDHSVESSCEIVPDDRQVDDASDPSSSPSGVSSNGPRPLHHVQQEQVHSRLEQQQLQHGLQRIALDDDMQDLTAPTLANALANLQTEQESQQALSHDMSHTQATDVVMSDVMSEEANCEDDAIVSVHKATLTGAPTAVESTSSHGCPAYCHGTSGSPTSLLVDRTFNTRRQQVPGKAD
ncbi:hypothetical protein KEM56_000570 [Ascosphaera pollenicola]|nr:hypothetical protein KEM56_000570 [Ascosphaera pollenicola]